ncbi:MAG TPA: MSMEG_1061 family FMN-dependent PPOX-type flavoprotein [Conexibacter sp.]|nr:MSMEG_1061 family FMN-dependent PPOX-type flavoprotein [Conexibacter sp.]
MPDDLLATALSSEAQLRELYGEPMQRALDKDIGRLDPMCRRLIAVAPIVFVASHDAEGNCDVTPRGGQPGFVTVLDDDHLAIPDATGNRRLDTLQNVVATGRAGLIFLIPGREQTLRVNGPACVTADRGVLDRLTPVGKPPRTAIVVRAESVYAHCPKAFVRSKLWDPETWPAADAQPTSAEVTLAHLSYPDLELEDVERMEQEALRHRLA